MARRHLRVVGTALLAAFAFIQFASAQDDMPDWTPEGVGVVKSDIPYIQCEVCKNVASQLHKQWTEKKEKATAAKRVGEIDAIELAEKICDRKSIAGGWILFTDMVEEGQRIRLEGQTFEGDCRSECRTIQKACEIVMGDRDTDVGEFMARSGVTEAMLEQFLCQGEISDACVAPPPPVPKGRKPGEPFEKKKEPDYGAMAQDMGLKDSVMHDPSSFQMPEGVPQMPPPKDFSKPSSGSKKKQKGKKARSEEEEEASWEGMTDL